MEGREDLLSILQYLPVVLRSSTVVWPLPMVALRNLSEGPDVSNVNSGRLLARAIDDMRDSLGILHLHSSASLGFSLFFDELMSRNDAGKWFRDVVPRLADLVLRLPMLLDSHYQFANNSKVETGLRLLNPQQPGIVLLGQISSEMPSGCVSFERKVLPWKTYPEPDFWSKSTLSLSQFEISTSGLIEDQAMEALEVDFANKYIGGGALRRGCVQEEIRFMINPELIVSMLFMHAMEDNEAIEIVGAERFSIYSGYASSFHFSGDYSDKKQKDTWGRRNTRIIAIDALYFPGEKQYKVECLLRETNKAFCGFSDLSRATRHDQASVEDGGNQCSENRIGVATGNWGCGAFGGDPQIKAVIQWLAASQALRPFILYHTLQSKDLQKLEGVVSRIRAHEWTVGDLWNVLVEYSGQRLSGETSCCFFKWLLPSLDEDDPMSESKS